MKGLSSLKGELDKCVRCGACRSICPTFRVLGRETAAARGKLTLIDGYLEGRIELSEAYIRHIKECTMCGGCRTGCPRGVDTTAIINAARADAMKKKGRSLAESFVMKNMLDYTGIMPRAMKYASRLKGLLFKGSTVENGLISRFSLPLVGGGRLLPELADTFFLDLKRVKGLDSDGKRGAEPAPASKVAFYAGCGVNFLMPGVGTASLDALIKTGSEVVVPASQVCCGMPAYYSGDIETAKDLAFKNLKVFEEAGADYIVTSCATCGHALKNVFREILSGTDDPEMKERVERFASKVRDITEFLDASAEGGIEEKKDAGGAAGGKKVVTYHDPCHLNRNQGIRDAPRELLRRNKNIEFREMRFPCSCCGLGGGVSLTNYELSINITKRKADSIRDSGADIVATACPGCIVQLRDGLHKYGVDAKVVHVVELL